MIIENRTVVTVNYRLTVRENEREVEVEKTDPAQPFVFLFGVSKLLPDFEKNLAGKSPGDTFDFVISAENGYGKRDDKNVIHIPIETFADESGDTDPEMLEIGKVLPMMDNAGNKYHGKIMEVNDEDVLMDFNHPLADRELHFSGEVADVRLATLEELQHGHVHGPGGHHH